MTTILSFIHENWLALLLGWFVLSCVSGPLIGFFWRPRLHDVQHQEPRNENPELFRAFAPARSVVNNSNHNGVQ